MEQSTALLGWLSLAEPAKIGTNVLVHLYLFLRVCNQPLIMNEISSQCLSVIIYHWTCAQRIFITFCVRDLNQKHGRKMEEQTALHLLKDCSLFNEVRPAAFQALTLPQIMQHHINTKAVSSLINDIYRMLQQQSLSDQP